MKFSVYYKEKVCGTIYTYDEDNFTVFDISCEIVNYNISRVYLKSGEKDVMLGILMPKNGKYVLKKKLAKAQVKKIGIDESFKGFIKCENDDKIEILNDKNLSGVICDEILKTSYSNFNTYSFEYSEKLPFIFDFCFILCQIQVLGEKKYITVKTNKSGDIIL